MYRKIETYIDDNLFGEMKDTALEFIEFLKVNDLTFCKDTCDCWKDKTYYWVKLGDECVCFIAINDPDEPNNIWTVWSDDCSAYEDASVSDEIKNIGWQYVDHCGSCGSCGGGKEKIIFGKSFPHVCGCTFRIDNATQGDLPFLKTMVNLRIRELMKNAAISHYDLLIDEDNDPVRDPKPLRDYMNKWDGPAFIEQMQLNSGKTVLEIGVGTGRLAIRVVPLCGEFYGVDISSKTVERAKENLSEFENVRLTCADFMSYEFDRRFDVIYSSLTFMHIEDKQSAVNKIAGLLNDSGRFVLSIDKNQSGTIDTGTRKITVYPDNPDDVKAYIADSGLTLIEQYETEFAHIFTAEKGCVCYCGHDCSKCVTYTATQKDDNELREKSQSFYKKQFNKNIPLEKFNCRGGRSGEVFELCKGCPFAKCCKEQGINFCAECSEYPCKAISDYQAKYVNKCNQI